MENIWKKFLQRSDVNAYSTPKTENTKTAFGVIIQKATLGRLKSHPKSSVLFGCAVACVIIGIVNQPQPNVKLLSSSGHSLDFYVLKNGIKTDIAPVAPQEKPTYRLVEPQEVSFKLVEPQEVKLAKMLPTDQAIDYNQGQDSREIYIALLNKMSSSRPSADADTEVLYQSLKTHSGQTPFDLDAVADADTERLATALSQHSGQVSEPVEVSDADTEVLYRALKNHSGQTSSPIKEHRLLQVEYNLLEQKSVIRLMQDEARIKGAICHYVTSNLEDGEVILGLRHAEMRAIDCMEVGEFNDRVTEQYKDPEIVAHMTAQVANLAKIGILYNTEKDNFIAHKIHAEPMEQALARAKLLNQDYFNENEEKMGL